MTNLFTITPETPLDLDVIFSQGVAISFQLRLLFEILHTPIVKRMSELVSRESTEENIVYVVRELVIATVDAARFQEKLLSFTLAIKITEEGRDARVRFHCAVYKEIL